MKHSLKTALILACSILNITTPALAGSAMPTCGDSLDTKMSWVKSTPEAYSAFSFIVRMHKKTATGSNALQAALKSYDFKGIDEDACLANAKNLSLIPKNCLIDDRLLKLYMSEICE